MILHVARLREVAADQLPPGTDLRTRTGREAEVLTQIDHEGGFTVFWATENIKRAYAINRLELAGVIKAGKKVGFPWHNYQRSV